MPKADKTISHVLYRVDFPDGAAFYGICAPQKIGPRITAIKSTRSSNAAAGRRLRQGGYELIVMQRFRSKAAAVRERDRQIAAAPKVVNKIKAGGCNSVYNAEMQKYGLQPRRNDRAADRIQRLRAAGRCTSCGGPRDDKKLASICRPCYHRQQVNQKNYQQRLREKARMAAAAI